jgi:geranylgeranyl diphosphate synthase type II
MEDLFNDKEVLKIINEAIEKEPFQGNPRELYEPLDYILSLGGKRIRPVMLLMTVNMYCGNLRRALPAALGIELFHNFSLIHDDIMDKAPIRRGQPTVHSRWNDNIAILSGDTMLVKAYERFLELPEPVIKPALKIFNRTAVEVCEGQQHDMNFETRKDVSIEEYLEMIRLKTAVLIGASFYLGGLLANVSESDLQNLYDFGIKTGMVFQLQDDLLDTYGDEKSFGKRSYGDISSNKKTYLYIKALELAEDDDKARLSALYSAPSSDPDVKIREVLEIFEKTGVKGHTQQKIREYHQLALQSFNALNVEPGRKKNLLEYTEALTGRIS